METKLTTASQEVLDQYRTAFRSADPFPHVVLDDFLAGDSALRCAASFPDFETAASHGRVFASVNERRKLQLDDWRHFPPEILELRETLASPEFLERLEYVTGIQGLLADPELTGGGIHQTGPHGHLDVHVDFNLISDRQLHRRLNILIYLNPVWQADWGGKLELWDESVRRCAQSLAPALNRCVFFATDHRSFHGVTALTCPEDQTRKSFAAYYYTKEPPEGWDGTVHNTIFKARPNEKIKRYVRMPAENFKRTFRRVCTAISARVKRRTN